MITFRTRLLGRRLILLVPPLIFLVYHSWAKDNSRTEASFHAEIKRVVDKALDDFASQFLLSVHLEVPEDLAKIFEIQSFLSCLVQNAEWRATMSGPKLVIPTTCSSARNVSLIFAVEGVCQLLPGKRVLLVGPDTTHFLHSLWLDVVEGRRNRTHTCPGRDYCTFHHICRSSAISPEDADIYNRAERKKKIPSYNFLRATRSAVLQYTYSTTLYAGSNRSDMVYQFPLVDLETGVRQISQYWLRRARKADLIILSRAPIPAPVSTYTLRPSGNWTFAFALCSQQKQFPANYCALSLPHALAIAALDMTLRNFLPSVIMTIRKLATDTSFQGSRRVWHGNWIIQPSCTVKGLFRDARLLPDFWSCSQDPADSCQVDPWTYFYNVQVQLQDRILPRILPYFGIIYLPMTFPIFDQGSKVRENHAPSGYLKDCIRAPWPNFAEELVQAFFIELSVLLALDSANG